MGWLVQLPATAFGTRIQVAGPRPLTVDQTDADRRCGCLENKLYSLYKTRGLTVLAGVIINH